MMLNRRSPCGTVITVPYIGDAIRLEIKTGTPAVSEGDTPVPSDEAQILHRHRGLLGEDPSIQILDEIGLIVADTHAVMVFFCIRAFIEPVGKIQAIMLQIICDCIGHGIHLAAAVGT
jgi:hypothetical protein